MERFSTKHTALQDSNGFTLVETVVAGILSVFVLMVAITVYRMNANQISGSFVNSLTNMQYQTVIDQIGYNAREASVISSTRATLLDASGVAIGIDSIFLFDITGNVFAGYKRSGTSLMELTGGAFSNFKVGNKNIQVKDVGNNNTFTIAPDRKSVALNLTVIGVDGSSKDTAYSNGESFICRY